MQSPTPILATGVRLRYRFWTGTVGIKVYTAGGILRALSNAPRKRQGAVGTSRHFAATQQFGRLLSDADIEPPEHDLGVLEFWDDRRRGRPKHL
jgi:hypothetical protein